jgi:hypothetical protein
MNRLKVGLIRGYTGIKYSEVSLDVFMRKKIYYTRGVYPDPNSVLRLF